MATKVDELLTIYRVTDDYSGKVSHIAASTDSLGEKIEKTLATVARFGLALTAVAAGAVLGIGAAAVKAAADFEQLQITLEVLTGSAQKAGEKLEFIRKLAIPATNTFQELAQAGVRLESFGLRAERVLPLIAKLGAAFGATGDDLQTLVRLFGRLGQGDFPDIEELSRFGLSKGQFKAQGVKFDESGKLLSSAKDTLDALDKIVESKYGNILDKIKNSTNAKLSSLKDVWETLLRKIGAALVKYAIPIIERLIKFVDNLTKNNNFDRFLANMGKNFIKFGLVVAGVLSTILVAIGLLRIALGDVIGGIITLITAAALTFGVTKYAREAIDFLKNLKTTGPGGSAVDVPKDTGSFFEGDPNGPMAQVAKNTKKTAENTTKALDLQKFALGGGPLGQIGVTPVELYGRRATQNTGGKTVTVKFEGRDGLVQYMETTVNAILLQLIRSGAIQVTR